MMISNCTWNTCRTSIACLMCCAMLGSIQLAAQLASPGHIASSPLVSNPLEAHSPIVLTAVNDPLTGKTAFSYNGREDRPVIRVNPGEGIRLTYVNAIRTRA
jgi:hypothetical protein